MIDNIKKAIVNLIAQREQISKEQARIVSELRSCHFMEFPHTNLIDKRYNDRIANIDREIDEMRVHLSVLQNEAPNA